MVSASRESSLASMVFSPLTSASQRHLRDIDPEDLDDDDVIPRPACR